MSFVYELKIGHDEIGSRVAALTLLPWRVDAKSPDLVLDADWLKSRGATSAEEAKMADQIQWPPLGADPLPDLGATLTPPNNIDNTMFDGIDGKLCFVNFLC